MLNSSKSTRKFAKNRVVILAGVLILFSGYSLYPYLGSVSTVTTTVTYPGQATTEIKTVTTTISSLQEINGSTVSNTTISTSSSNTKSNQSATLETSTTSNTSSGHTSGAGIYKIPQSKLQELFKEQGLDQAGVEFSPSPTNVPYEVVSVPVKNSTPTTLLLYLDTDVALSSCYGYNSYIGTLVLVNTTGTIQNLTIYTNLDSWGYEITQVWLNTYVNRSVYEQLQFGVDAQPVTGATFSSTGVIDGVRDGGRIVVNDYNTYINNGDKEAPRVGFLATLKIFGIFAETGQFNPSIAAIISLFILAVVVFELKSNRRRYEVYV